MSDEVTDLRADVGVLLVHGIGDHVEGDTLLSFGDPMIDWIREWLAGGPARAARGAVTVVEARLRAVRSEPESPAFALVEIAPRLQDPERWLFSEAWWGDSVKAPGTALLLTWMLSRVPLLVMWHFFGGAVEQKVATAGQARVAMRLSRPVPAWMALPVKLVLVPPLVLLMQTIVCLALILWVVPIGPWRNALFAVVRMLTLTLGDSYVLLEQEVQRAALVERVRRNLKWLAARAQRLIVVAHSQGGAIAHEALRGDGPAVEALVSVGSGLEKLEFLRLVRVRRRGVVASALAAPLMALGIAGLAMGWAGWTETKEPWWYVLPFVLLGAGVICSTVLFRALAPYADELAAVLEDSRQQLEHRCGVWWDFYATLDLVPMGGRSMLPAFGANQVELRNECSLVSDHVRYFRSWCGFTARCWELLVTFSRRSLLEPGDLDRLRRLGEWHARRAFALGFGTTLLPLALVAAAFAFSDGLVRIGSTVGTGLDAAEMKWTQRGLQAAAEAAARGIGFVLSLDNDAGPVATRSQLLLALALSALALLGWWIAVLSLWRADSRGRWLHLCEGRSWLIGSAAYWVGLPMLAFWAVAAMLPVLALLIAAHSPEALTISALGRSCLFVAAAVVGAGAAAGALAAGWLLRSARQGLDLPRTVMPLALAFGVGFYGGVADLLWSVASATRFDARLAEVTFVATALGCWLFMVAIGGLPVWLRVSALLAPPLAVAATALVGGHAPELIAAGSVAALAGAGAIRHRLA